MWQILFWKAGSWGSRFRGSGQGQVENEMRIKVNIWTWTISYKIESLIYGAREHSLNWGYWKCNRCKGRGKQGVNENTARQIYMNKEHMEAGLERDKRWDFTINNIQGWELITTKFEHGNLVLGILEVIWMWQRWLLESGMGQKLISNCLWVLWDVTVFPPQGSHPKILRKMQGASGIGTNMWRSKWGLRRHQDLK